MNIANIPSFDCKLKITNSSRNSDFLCSLEPHVLYIQCYAKMDEKKCIETVQTNLFDDPRRQN